MNEKIERIKQLTATLNYHRNLYYNESKNEVSDLEYDTMFDELKSLEDETGFILSNSATQTVGYPVNSKFDKVTHNKPLLSLDKTQDINEFIKFCSVSPVLLMHKLDGLTIHIEYRNGTIYKASTRGDGITGDDITTNIKYFSNIPITVNNKDTFTVTGEAVIDRTTFNNINNSLPDNERFKNPRNLASGTVKQLDTSIVSSRNIKFLCWNANDLSTDGTMLNGLDNANTLGFDTVTYYTPTTNLSELVPECIETLKNNTNNIPIDGIVAMYNNIAFGESLGKTSHHFNNGFAFKFYDEEEESTLTEIEWSIGKTGELCPVAIFNPVIIDGTTVTRASLHNITVMTELLGKPYVGQHIWVKKSNMIIPQITKAVKINDLTE